MYVSCCSVHLDLNSFSMITIRIEASTEFGTMTNSVKITKLKHCAYNYYNGTSYKDNINPEIVTIAIVIAQYHQWELW